MDAGTCRPCQWVMVGWSSWLNRLMRIFCPFSKRITGPRYEPCISVKVFAGPLTSLAEYCCTRVGCPEKIDTEEGLQYKLISTSGWKFGDALFGAIFGISPIPSMACIQLGNPA